MELKGARAVPAPAEQLWRVLHDPETMRSCMPGCNSLEADGVNAYRLAITAKVGPISARFAGKMQLADLDAPRAYTLRFEGSGGAAGFVHGEARVTLTPDGSGTTTLSYVAKAQVGGKLAQIGSRLIDGAAQKLTDEFFAQLVAATTPKTEELRAPHAAEARPRRVMYLSLMAAIGAVLLAVYLASRR
jgi:carbon monoxide dehydrogenase subunit G